MKFYNSTKKDMDIYDVCECIKEFILLNPKSEFKLAVGTDSHTTGNNTCFVTGIHIHRVGSGAWCCIRKIIEKKRYINLKEKIATETAMTYEVVYTLNELLYEFVCKLLLEHKDFNFSLEAHIDIGTKGKTRTLIREMLGFFENLGIEAKIKPDSFVASSYANRYSKSMKIS